MERTETELLSAARTGDLAAIEELLQRHEKQVFRFGLRMCGSEDDARDVLQETLLAAFKHLPEFRGDAQLSTWLYQIARSFCTKRRRLTSGEPESTLSIEAPEAAAVPAPSDAPDTQAHAREVGEILQAAVLALPEVHREVIVLRDVEGLPAAQAAAVLGIEVGALKSRLHRARLELRQKLSALLGDEVGEGGEPCAQPHCPELQRELAEYASADIDQATCVRIEEHLQRCPRCAPACAALQSSVSLCSRIPGGEVPAPIRSAVRQALRQVSSQ